MKSIRYAAFLWAAAAGSVVALAQEEDAKLKAFSQLGVVARGISPPLREEDGRLNAFFQSYLEAHFRQQPLRATELGDHHFDHLLDDLSAGARARWSALARQTLAELPRQVNQAWLSRFGQVDFEILQQDLARSLWLGENTHPYEEDPRAYNDYLSDSVYLLLTQSTLPKETNLTNCLARMALLPRVVAAAKQSLRHPPRVFV